MNSKEKKEAVAVLKEATLVFYQAMEKFKKAVPFNEYKGVLGGANIATKKLAKRLHQPLGPERFPKVVVTNPAPIPQPRQVEESEPEETAVLADNAETPKAKRAAAKKRSTGRKRGRPSKKK